MAIDITGKVAGSIVNRCPTKTVENRWLQKKIDYIGDKFSPTHNRLILGASALLSQPFIDLHNKDVDEKTRKMSAARTIAKIIAGTLTGVLIREACIRGIQKWTMTPEELKAKGKAITKQNTLLIPDKVKIPDTKVWKEISHKEFGEALRLIKNHRKTLGTIIALGIMVVTNFLLDVPITKFLTNVFAKKFDNNDVKKNDAKGDQK